MPDRVTKPAEPWSKPDGEGEGGPRMPDIHRPNTDKLLEKMRRVDPRAARRYRQRSGE